MNPTIRIGLVAALLACATARAQTAAQITLPAMLAVELPNGTAQIGPRDSPLRELLADAHCDSRRVTADLKRKVGVGAIKVTWSCLDETGKPAATRTARIFVLPSGMTPVGMTRSESATAGNNSVHIARDSGGAVHMIWKDSGGKPEGPVYRRARIDAKGAVKFETPPIHVAQGGPGDWNAYPALAVTGRDVQLIWQGGGTLRARRVSSGVLGPVIDTGAKSEGRDVGPAVAIDPQGGVHVATPNGVYAFSGDGGRSWKTEPIPLPPNTAIKTISIAADPAGAVHIAFSAPVTRPDPPGAKLGGYWQLRAIDRVNGSWTNPTDVLARAPGWGEPKNTDDILADWARIEADRQGGLHLTWHGTTYSHKFAHDTAFYAFKKAGAGWSSPVTLVRTDPSRGITFSYAPSLALDGDRAFALVFYEIDPTPDTTGYDTVLAFLRNGQMEGAPMPVSQFVRAAMAVKQPDAAMGSRFPAAAPALWHAPDGHVWLDMLELIQAPADPKGENIVVYHRLDLTARLKH